MIRFATACAFWILVLSSCTVRREAIELPIDPPSAPLTGDYERLQGTWVVTYNEIRTRSLPEMAGALFVFESDRFRLGTDRGFEWYAIDERSEPKRIDFYDRRSPTIRGIYRFDGDTLVICTGAPGSARPKTFETSIFSGTVLTRVTKR